MTKNKKMKAEPAIIGLETEAEKSPTAEADNALDAAKGKFQAVLVIGLDEKNNIDISTNVPQYAVMQYWLSRAAFELNVHEQRTMQQANAEATANEG